MTHTFGETPSNTFLVGFTSDGSVLYDLYFGEAGHYETATCVQTLPNGNIAVVGYTEGTADSFMGVPALGGQDIFIVLLDSTGNHLETKLWGNSLDDVSNGCFLGPDGKLYVVGETTSHIGYTTNKGGTDAFIALVHEP